MHICSSCGGTMLQTIQNGVWECEYCGIRSNVLTQDNPEIAGLKSRANALLQDCDFDAAAALYSEALALSGEDAELYWLLTMCTYGIEFVDEGNKRIPTCHRTLVTPIQRNENYQNALDCADSLTRQSYESMGARIQVIQKKILQIARQEAPYDVFLCYKQTDEAGIRTAESSVARELYHKLNNSGYRVFFAEETLNKEHTGQEFEPYIYAALNSAPILIVIGFTKAHFEAVWVKNEWHRYLVLQKKKKNLRLIPYFNSNSMSKDDIPSELSGHEYLDATKLGTSDLLRIVQNRIAPKDGGIFVESEISAEGRRTNWTVEIRQLLLRKDWVAARQLCDQSLTIDSSFAWGYIGRLCTEFQISDISKLGEVEVNLKGYNDFNSALQYADDELASELEGIHKSTYYNYGISLLNIGKNEINKLTDSAISNYHQFCSNTHHYTSALTVFRELGDYRDSQLFYDMCEFYLSIPALFDIISFTERETFCEEISSYLCTEQKFLPNKLDNRNTFDSDFQYRQVTESIITKIGNQLLNSEYTDTLSELVEYMATLRQTPNIIERIERYKERIERHKEDIYAIGKKKLEAIRNGDTEVTATRVREIFESLGNYKDSSEIYNRLLTVENRIDELQNTLKSNQENKSDTQWKSEYTKESYRKDQGLYSALLVVLVVSGLLYMIITISQIQPVDMETFLWKAIVSEFWLAISPVLVLFGIEGPVYILYWIVVLAVVVIPFFIQMHILDDSGGVILLSVLCLVFNFPGCLIVTGILKHRINNWKSKATFEVEEADKAYRNAIKPINEAHAEILRLIAQVEKTK